MGNSWLPHAERGRPSRASDARPARSRRRRIATLGPQPGRAASPNHKAPTPPQASPGATRHGNEHETIARAPETMAARSLADRVHAWLERLLSPETASALRRKTDVLVGIVRDRLEQRRADVDGGGTLPPEFMARYRIEGLLGTGATSVVHLRRGRVETTPVCPGRATSVDTITHQQCQRRKNHRGRSRSSRSAVAQVPRPAVGRPPLRRRAGRRRRPPRRQDLPEAAALAPRRGRFVRGNSRGDRRKTPASSRLAAAATPRSPARVRRGGSFEIARLHAGVAASRPVSRDAGTVFRAALESRRRRDPSPGPRWNRLQGRAGTAASPRPRVAATRLCGHTGAAASSPSSAALAPVARAAAHGPPRHAPGRAGPALPRPPERPQVVRGLRVRAPLRLRDGVRGRRRVV